MNENRPDEFIIFAVLIDYVDLCSLKSCCNTGALCSTHAPLSPFWSVFWWHVHTYFQERHNRTMYTQLFKSCAILVKTFDECKSLYVLSDSCILLISHEFEVDDAIISII